MPVEQFEDESINKGSKKPSESDMLYYYKRLLPFRQIFQWLSHSPKPTKDFTFREFAYEHRSGAYQRYNSYTSLEDFKQTVINANPTRFEIGAVYKINPKDRKNLPKSVMKPVSKELVFDIDLTDYDDIRTCCQGTDICCKCWKFIQVGSKIIEFSLRQDFGFQHLIWVFSGRRGAHCWISDIRARNLDENSRRSIVEYLDILGKNGNKKSIKKPYHPHIERSFEILKNEFNNIVLTDQDPWFTDSTMSSDSKNWKCVDDLLSFIPNKELSKELKSKWQKDIHSTSKDKWEDINTIASKVLKSKSEVNYLNDAKKDIIIYFMYPRLDIEVSRQIIHLLKSPFCIHPGTGNVCVPFNPFKNISDNKEDDEYGFNPLNSPNIRDIQNELENYNKGNNELHDWEKTSLKPYIEYFSHFVNELTKEELKKRSRDNENENNLEF
ncbi:unnamed protein product [Candida verbasci]|uniref:DNA primase n=1 Tax=Candida verbasci TaxID=1227364 RepID=A0A9W4U1Q1_9ASCO|nr:unnamed protein product [Candida verbasci]